jgi:hypothetical protein
LGGEDVPCEAHFPRLQPQTSILRCPKPVGPPSSPFFPPGNLEQLVVRKSFWLSYSEATVLNSLLAGGYEIHVGYTLGEGTESWLSGMCFTLLNIVYGVKEYPKSQYYFHC